MSLLKYIYRMAACQISNSVASYCSGFVKGRVLPTEHCCIVPELMESLYRPGLSF